MRYLLDTCVISELVSKKPNQNVITWIDSIEDEHIFLSAITLGEIQKGITKLPESKRKQTLQMWLADDLIARFDGRILDIDLSVMLTWGTLCGRLDQSGRPLPAIDSLIAALALHHQMQLVTRNVSDFAGTGVNIFNPWHTA